jgi:hypothetical protein
MKPTADWQLPAREVIQRTLLLRVTYARLAANQNPMKSISDPTKIQLRTVP